MKLPRNLLNGWIVTTVPAPKLDNKWQGWGPCMDWCKLNVKEQNWRYSGEGAFEFRRADDHMMFVLRWS